jgi:diguanylate cyclase (GGDEF)-like protein
MTNNMLIVDDSGHLHTLIRKCLEPELLSIHSAYDGASAMSAAVKCDPRLVLLDVNIPGIDGFEVCQRLKADPHTAGAAVMFMTADTSSDRKAKGLELGAIDYLIKPFKPETFRARVRLALRTLHRQEGSDLIDRLTGLWNESYLGADLPAQLSWASRSGSSLACITVKVDPITRADEHYEDVAGEEILRTVADIFQRQCRGCEDTVYYCGGRTFAALLARTNSAGAERVAERVRQQIKHEMRRDDEGTLVQCSFGIADTEVQTDVPLLQRAISAKEMSDNSRTSSAFVRRSVAPSRSVAA